MRKKTHEDFIEELKLNKPDIFNEIRSVENYKGAFTHLDIIDKNGFLHKISPTVLLRKRSNFNIRSAVDKTSYFIHKASCIHNNKYDYSDSVYIKKSNYINIKCNTHGVFKQSVDNHLAGQGCPLCAFDNKSGWTYSKWENAGNVSNKFDSYKLYIIKCFNEKEHFYKIGKTFNLLSVRFGDDRKMPYKYEPLIIIEGKARYISELEIKYKNKYKAYKYLPKEEFKGKHECFNINMFENA